MMSDRKVLALMGGGFLAFLGLIILLAVMAGPDAETRAAMALERMATALERAYPVQAEGGSK